MRLLASLGIGLAPIRWTIGEIDSYRVRFFYLTETVYGDNTFVLFGLARVAIWPKAQSESKLIENGNDIQ
jgi:hypothetical protein